MGRSRRAFRKSNPTVRVGLPKRKSAKSLVPDTIVLPGTDTKLEWDGKASLISNYKSMGIVANPNVVGARSGTRHLVQLVSLQKPLSADGSEHYGSDDEPDDVKSVLHKKRSDGKKAPLQKLTTMQRVYVSRLILKHGEDYVVSSHLSNRFMLYREYLLLLDYGL
ncbi:hypothetical protein M758_5G011600 [Ceratodon purpureus]|nr:hypothetical protein M758_5G011600 [Ceratodon purpureus]